MTSAVDGTPTFPLPRMCPFDPPPEYRKIREQEPVSLVNLPNGKQAWAVTRYEDVRFVLTDRRFSVDRFNPDFPAMIEGDGVPRPDEEQSIMTMDEPEHGPARRAVVGEFNVRRIETLRPRVQQIVDEQIDALLAGPKPAELVTQLALPVSSLVIYETLGVPYADHEFFQRHTASILKTDISGEERFAAFGAIRDYLDQLVTDKEADPPDDLLGRQIRQQRETGKENHAALVTMALLLLVAGHETTASMIALGTLLLLENPDQLAELKADPGKTRGAIEELLRYLTITDVVTARLCVEDVKVGGVTIRAGEGVLALTYAANRDPEAFPNPDAFDIGRTARHHLAFGFGAHQCLGQNLARLEMQVVLDTLFRRIPDLRLATDIGAVPLKHDAAVFGLHALPVTW